MFICSSCKRYRNDFDRSLQGTCLRCAGRSGIVRPQKSQSKSNVPKLPCQSCWKFIGPGEGQKMKSNGRVFCWDCLTSGKWIDYLRAHGVKTVTEEHQKKGARFGRG